MTLLFLRDQHSPDCGNDVINKLAKPSTESYFVTFVLILNQTDLLMDIKKLFAGGITGGIVYFLFGYLVYGNLLVDFMKSNPGTAIHVDRATPEMLYLVIGNLLTGFFLAWIFARSAVSGFKGGFVSGAVFGLLYSASINSIMYATTNTVSRKAMLADVLAFTVISAITGAIVALVIGMGKKS